MDDFRTPEDLFKEGSKRFSEAGRDFLKYVPGIMLIIVLVTNFKTLIYSIGPDEVGVIQRFGKYVRQADPGLHVKIPFGVEKATPVKVKKIFKEEFGFRTLVPDIKTEFSSKQYPDESLMLTGDLNILDVRWIVQFRVNDPVKLLFKVRDPVDTIRDLSKVVMGRLCGDYRVDELLTTKREEIDHNAQNGLQKLLDKYDTGIEIVTVKLLDVNPPDVVKPAFNNVNEAKQEKERLINEAWKEYNTIIPKAKGEALRTVSQAEGYALGRVNRAKGESARFIITWREYIKAKEVTRKRLYLEAISDSMAKVSKKYIFDSKQKSILPLMDINAGQGDGAK